MKRPAATAAALFLGLIAVAHLLRVLFRVPISAGGRQIPAWTSVLGIVLPGLLAVWLWRERRS